MSEKCPSYSFDPKKDLVHCSKEFDKKGLVRKVRQEVCDLCWGRIQGRKDEIQKDLKVAAEIPCVCRYISNDEFFCARNAPVIRRIEHRLKSCQACPHRLTEAEVAEFAARGEFTETKRYITCGAKEKQDAKVGMLVFDSKNPDCPHQGYAVPIEACFQAKCSYAKLMQVISKRLNSS